MNNFQTFNLEGEKMVYFCGNCNPWLGVSSCRCSEEQLLNSDHIVKLLFSVPSIYHVYFN